jgi:hypothetical protein
MAIRTNVGTGVVPVQAADTTLFAPSVIDRYQVGSCNVYNTTASAITFNVYISPDLTSAAGDLIFSKSIGAGAEIDINPIVGQGYATENVIVTGSAVGLNAQLTRTEYDNGS